MQDEYQLMIAQVNMLVQRRQGVTSTYLTVNTAITGAVALLFKDGHLQGPWQAASLTILLISGLCAATLWRRLILQHSAIIGWWYDQIRHCESIQHTGGKIFTKEYEKLYTPKAGTPHYGLTRHETRLTWVFSGVYLLFFFGLLAFIAYTKFGPK